MGKLVARWVWRVLAALWATWLTFKHVLGVPGDIDDAKKWQVWLKEWGVWDIVIDPRPAIYPAVFLVAVALILLAWDVPQRLRWRWSGRKGGDNEIEIVVNGWSTRDNPPAFLAGRSSGGETPDELQIKCHAPTQIVEESNWVQAQNNVWFKAVVGDGSPDPKTAIHHPALIVVFVSLKEEFSTSRMDVVGLKKYRSGVNDFTREGGKFQPKRIESAPSELLVEECKCAPIGYCEDRRFRLGGNQSVERHDSGTWRAELLLSHSGGVHIARAGLIFDWSREGGLVNPASRH